MIKETATRYVHLQYSGAVEERGGAHMDWGWCGAAMRRAQRFSLRTYNTQRSRRVWGNAPLGKVLKFRPYESASEAVGDHDNHAKCLTTGL